MQIQNYKDLVVWQKSMALVVEIYKLTTLLPRDELYGLSSQMRRAVTSIPFNTAEGFHRNHAAEKIQFYAIAYGSSAELATQIEVCKRLNFLNSSQTQLAESLLSEVMRMLNTLSNKRTPVITTTP